MLPSPDSPVAVMASEATGKTISTFVVDVVGIVEPARQKDDAEDETRDRERIDDRHDTTRHDRTGRGGLEGAECCGATFA